MATVNTVLGLVDASQIGGTMSHVHLTINILCWFREPDSGVQRGISEQNIFVAESWLCASQRYARERQLSARQS